MEELMRTSQSIRARTEEALAPSESAGDDVLAGLLATQKRLPCRLLYDAQGAELFERICELPEYYPTRTELSLLREHLPAVAEAVGPDARVIEPGSGAGQKTRMLLAALQRPASYVPIDVAAEQLFDNAVSLRRELPGLEVTPVCGDYTAELTIPRSTRPSERTLIFFPGSTIGNFEPDEAVGFLSGFAAQAGRGGMLLLGADSNQNPDTLVPAYDDAQGVTAAFDLNLLAHVNRTHQASFELAAFRHRAVWNAARSRVEMHLVSKKAQTVEVAGRPISFERGEAIVTEHCYKHARPALEALLRRAGWSVVQMFSDDAQRMGLWLAVRSSDRAPHS
jgi:L-histidine Nalpha-methyltransferase